MASLSITSAKITGNPDKSGWAQVHEYKPDDKEKLALRGLLFAIVATSNIQEGVDSVSAGRELLSRLHEEYFGKTSASAFSGLKEAVEKVISEFSSSWGDVEIAAAVFLKGVLYSVVGGGAQVALLRDSAMVKILVSQKSKVVSASGYPRDKDILFLGTSAFFDKVDEGTVKEVLKGSIQEASEVLTSSVHAKEGAGNAGAALINFSERDVLEISTGGEKPMLQEKTRPLVGKLKSDLANFLQKIIEKLPEKKIYIKGETIELGTHINKKLAIPVGAILIGLLAVSIFFGIRQKAKRVEKQKYSEQLVQAKHEFEEAKSLYSLNPVRSRELILSARGAVEDLLAQGISDSEIESLRDSIEESVGSILGEYNSQADLFVDLSLLSQDFSGDEMASSEGQMYVLDKQGKRIASVFIETKTAEIVVGPDQAGDAESVSGYVDKVYILSKDGIYEVGKQKKKLIDEIWPAGAWTYSYAGNLYVLEKVSSSIFRFPAIEGGFASKQNWFGSGVAPDLTKALSWTIDGSVWVLLEKGEILKFTRGSPEAFSISGVSPSISGATSIYTDENLKHIYILEPGNKRIVVLDKDGTYKAQYFSEKLSEGRGLFVSETEKKIIFLTKGVLYSIALGHLEE